jgi:hypothetical protein
MYLPLALRLSILVLLDSSFQHCTGTPQTTQYRGQHNRAGRGPGTVKNVDNRSLFR